MVNYFDKDKERKHLAKFIFHLLQTKTLQNFLREYEKFKPKNVADRELNLRLFQRIFSSLDSESLKIVFSKMFTWSTDYKMTPNNIYPVNKMSFLIFTCCLSRLWEQEVKIVKLSFFSHIDTKVANHLG